MLLQRDAFLYSTRGMLGFSGADSWPEFFAEGQVIKTRLVLFNLIPAWSYEIRVVRVDSSNRLFVSQEKGGLIRKWNHRKWIEEGAEAACRYTDEIDIDAGVLTFFIWTYAHVFYRYRQRRMRRWAADACSAR